MIVDFLVHPERDKRMYGKFPDAEVERGYLLKLANMCRSSELPILISGHSEKIFKEIIPHENEVKSRSFFLYDRSHGQGEVVKWDWEKFTALLEGKEKEEMRIHGSNIKCTQGFAVQLFAYLELNRAHWSNRAVMDFPGKDGQREDELRRHHESIGSFAKSKIRYGEILAPEEKIRTIKPSSRLAKILRLAMYPNGNITYQLIDDKTRIHRVQT
jgi:hypothetical protein